MPSKSFHEDPFREYLESLLRHTTLTPLWATFWRCKADWSQPSRRLTDTMWYYFYQGRGICRFGDDRTILRFTPGTLFLIPEGVPHAVTPDPNQRIVAVTAHFHARLYGSVDILKVLELGGAYRGKTVRPWADGSKQLAEESLHHPPGWVWSMEAILRQLLVDLIRRRNLSLTESRPLRVLSQLWGVLEFVEQNLSDPRLRVLDLAEVLDFSEVSLRKLFQKADLPAPAEFLRRRRIQRACTLLRTTRQSIQQIARLCGYQDTPLFYRQFKAQTRTTPKLFRERIEP
ncbi:MAG: helix-turn-helix transcriptional regulator [Phycisphaerae bacterium]|nr:helix-turn-helix transcriptional regulator [Phycisphaerae bacterium]